MRVLLITGTFAGPSTNPWLLDDLAQALVGQGHDVDVLVADAKGGRPRGLEQRDGMRIRSVGSPVVRRGAVGRLLGHLANGIGLHGQGFRFARATGYDLVLHTSIACFTWGLPARLRRRGIARRLTVVLWDFFPVHQVEIGRMPGGPVAAVAKAAERRALTAADTIAVMSPANREFAARYFGLTTPTVIQPPWSGSGEDAPPPVAGSSARTTAVFGGQLTAGRGLDTLLAAAELLDAEGVPLDLVIAGDGAHRARLEERARGLANTRFTGALPRDAYRRLLGEAQVGIAVTVAGVSPPTFPSKIVEYAGAGLWIVACVEAASDAGALIEAHGAGVGVPAGDAERLAAALRDATRQQATGDLVTGRRAARAYWEADLSADVAARRLAETAR